MNKRLPIAAPGWPFLLPATGATLLSYLFYRPILGFITAITLLLFWFFRDPERHPESEDSNAILSPADGKIADITEVGEFRRVGIFLSIFNCHVQRSPLDGVVESVERKGGLFLAAFNPEASAKNVSSTITCTHPTLGKFKVRQITGLIARRIITDVTAKSHIQKGARIGMILMGSRVELEIPKDKASVSVKIGDVVYGGQTAVGKFK